MCDGQDPCCYRQIFVNRRQRPHGASGIGIWNKVQEALTTIAIFSNVMLKCAAAARAFPQ